MFRGGNLPYHGRGIIVHEVGIPQPSKNAKRCGQITDFVGYSVYSHPCISADLNMYAYNKHMYMFKYMFMYRTNMYIQFICIFDIHTKGTVVQLVTQTPAERYIQPLTIHYQPPSSSIMC